MLIVETIPNLRREIRRRRLDGKRIAFVPTMGHLHDGHLKLVKTAEKSADCVVVSIFISKMQFENPVDFEKYPRTLHEDCEKLKRFNVDLLFHPSTETMYPNGLTVQTYIKVPELSDILEGESRPGHFRGVSTVVGKCLNLIQPDIVLLGEKDYQQLQLIRKMVSDLAFDVSVLAVPTERDGNGLALSSRNTLLSAEELQIAPKLYQVMTDIGEKLIAGERTIDAILKAAEEQLRDAGFTPQPLFIRDANTLQPLTDKSKKAVILMAAILGQTRLIDNLEIDLP